MADTQPQENKTFSTQQDKPKDLEVKPVEKEEHIEAKSNKLINLIGNKKRLVDLVNHPEKAEEFFADKGLSEIFKGDKGEERFKKFLAEYSQGHLGSEKEVAANLQKIDDGKALLGEIYPELVIPKTKGADGKMVVAELANIKIDDIQLSKEQAQEAINQSNISLYGAIRAYGGPFMMDKKNEIISQIDKEVSDWLNSNAISYPVDVKTLQGLYKTKFDAYVEAKQNDPNTNDQAKKALSEIAASNGVSTTTLTLPELIAAGVEIPGVSKEDPDHAAAVEKHAQAALAEQQRAERAASAGKSGGGFMQMLMEFLMPILSKFLPGLEDFAVKNLGYKKPETEEQKALKKKEEEELAKKNDGTKLQLDAITADLLHTVTAQSSLVSTSPLVSTQTPDGIINDAANKTAAGKIAEEYLALAPRIESQNPPPVTDSEKTRFNFLKTQLEGLGSTLKQNNVLCEIDTNIDGKFDAKEVAEALALKPVATPAVPVAAEALVAAK
jgi:hypothetical protein